MIVCPRCSKQNQDHYKFCLGCGAELPKDAAHAPKAFAPPTPPPPGFGGDKYASIPPSAGLPSPVAPRGASLIPGGTQSPKTNTAAVQAPAPVQTKAAGGAATPAAAATPAPQTGTPQTAANTVTCPKCGASVAAHFKFCGACGHPMAPATAAPTPAVAVPAAVAPTAAPAAAAPVVSETVVPQPSAPKPVQVTQPQAASTAPRGMLVLIRPDGSEGESFGLREPETAVGRNVAGPFASDSYLSPRHATFRFDGAALWVRDESSLNGVFVRLQADTPTELQDGSVFRIGQEVIRFELIRSAEPRPDGVEIMGSPNPGYLGRISLVIGRAATGNSYPIAPDGLLLGRERGDILFPDDGYVSGLHCRIYGEGGKVLLTDVGSSNGTFIRVRGERKLEPGAMLLMGQQLYRADFK